MTSWGVAHMLHPVSYAELIRTRREAAGLSMRELAERAHVAPSTVSRIEAEKVSPSAETIDRLLLACGLERKAAPADIPSIASLRNAWNTAAARPDWTRIRALLDRLDLHPEYRSPATLVEPAPCESPVMDNLLAGIAETIADLGGYRRPRWTGRIEPLDQEWSMPGTPRMLEARRESTPPRLASRNITVDQESLWRHPARIA